MQPTIALSSPMAQAFFHQHPDAVLVLDAAGKVLLANAAAQWLAGPDGEFADFAQMTGTPWPEPSVAEAEQGRRWTRRLRTQGGDGRSRMVDASLFQIETEPHEPNLYYGVLRDVTASLSAAQKGQEFERRSRLTGETAPVLIWMAGPDMMCEWFNKTWLQFRGRTLGDELGEGWTEGVHPEDLERCLGIYSYCFEMHEPFSLDYRLLRHDGAYRWVMCTGMPRYGNDGEFLGYIGTCLDITDRKELEDRLAEHTRHLRLADKRREDFLGKLSHELRNPLAPIANAAAILRAVEHGNPNLVQVREIIERQVAALRRLITDLVDVTRITRGKVVLQRETLDMDRVVDAALEETRAEMAVRGHEVRLHRTAQTPHCTGDAHRLAQAIAALLSNAAKFSPDGSTITLATRVVGPMLEVVVRDPGRGIAPQFLPQAFELFAQAEQTLARPDSGLGVGLTIAQRVAQLHGGEVELESAGHNLGTTAILRVPLTDAKPIAAGAANDATLVPRYVDPASPRGDEPAQAADAAASGAAEPGASRAVAHADDPLAGGEDLSEVTGRRVLIVEDNVDARESLRMVLELGGNEVLTASSAADGLALAESFMPHLIVCDIGLPDLDGYELVRRLRDVLPGASARIVALTGYGRVEDRERALDSGFDSFLVKPWTTRAAF